MSFRERRLCDSQFGLDEAVRRVFLFLEAFDARAVGRA